MSKKLERLLKKEQQLKAQIQLVQAAERTKEKKKETRRKLLIGSAITSQIEAGEFSEQDLIKMMDAFLTRPNERALFGLSTAEQSQPKQNIKQAPSTTTKKSTSKRKRTTRKATATAKKRSAAKKAQTTD